MDSGLFIIIIVLLVAGFIGSSVGMRRKTREIYKGFIRGKIRACDEVISWCASRQNVDYSTFTVILTRLDIQMQQAGEYVRYFAAIKNDSELDQLIAEYRKRSAAADIEMSALGNEKHYLIGPGQSAEALKLILSDLETRLQGQR